MTKQTLPLLLLGLALAACSPGNPSTPAAGGSPSPAASAATTGDHLLVDGTPTGTSGKSTITAFTASNSGSISAVFGLAPLTIPSGHIFVVDVQLADSLPDKTKFGTAEVKRAFGHFNGHSKGTTWTADATANTTFSLAVDAKKVSLTWQDAITDDDGKTYQIDAVMTNTPVPF